MNAQHKFLILGSNGQLGRQFKIDFQRAGRLFDAPEEQRSDLTDFNAIEKLIEDSQPDVIINCAAYNAVEDAERKPDIAYLVNGKAVEHLARVCNRHDIILVHYSSDYVFDGLKGAPYTEEDKPNPLNIYGRSKLSGERAILDNLTRFLLFRTSWVYGDGTQNFIHKLLQWASSGKELKLSSDEVSVPTSTVDLARCTLLALDRGLTGLFHLTNGGVASRYEWGRYVLAELGKNNAVVPVPMSSFPSAVQRPLYTAMSNSFLEQRLGVPIPDWKKACSQFLATKQNLSV